MFSQKFFWQKKVNIPSWIRGRKRVLLSIFIDFFCFLSLFFFSNNKITEYNPLLFLYSFLWIFFSYLLNRYGMGIKTNLRYILRCFLLTILCSNLILFLLIFGLQNFSILMTSIYQDFIPNYLQIIYICFLSLFIQINLFYFFKPLLNLKEKWIFLGKEEEFNLFQRHNAKTIRSSKPVIKVIEDIELFEKNKYKLDCVGFIIQDDNLYDSVANDYKLLKNYSVFKISNWIEYQYQKIPSIYLPIYLNYTDFINFNNLKIQLFIKRISDSFLSILILIFTSPVIFISAIMIKLEDGGPIFYKQNRTGYRGRIFNIIKLRTMVVNAESGKAIWSFFGDNRITKIGKILRKLRIDELPQLLNVLRGEMSLIGPRPEREEIEKSLIKEIPHYSIRSLIKPGLSGWAQVSYHYGASIQDSENKLAYDIYYLKNFSLFLDLMIFFKTMRLVFNAEGSSSPNKNKMKN